MRGNMLTVLDPIAVLDADETFGWPESLPVVIALLEMSNWRWRAQLPRHDHHCRGRHPTIKPDQRRRFRECRPRNSTYAGEEVRFFECG